MPHQEVREGIDRHPHGDLLRKGVVPRRQQRKRDGFAVQPSRESQRRVVSLAERFRLVMHAVHPCGTDGVQDILCRQAKRPRLRAAARRDVADRAARRQQLRPRRPVDGAVRARPDHRAWIRGVDDGIHPHLRNVVAHDLKRHLLLPQSTPRIGCFLYDT